ncbi:hypothetical protein IEQ34_017729 [Dendrobium chrysotoxum]|uniref:Uncharacterized protein n=1 Tax=Dendrobium chrysotoxum TaxID=161865 RepID=A0AAV7FUL0_DENCH|nr:hypothetical protein IEQ34_017729 [Dendrobium chrysotoxum]
MAAKPTETLAPVPPAMPQPRSPPKYPDICGRHRLQVEAQILNREILFLEGERFAGGEQGCCVKAVVDEKRLVSGQYCDVCSSDGFRFVFLLCSVCQSNDIFCDGIERLFFCED